MVYWLNKPRGMLEEHEKRLLVTSRRQDAFDFADPSLMKSESVTNLVNTA